MNALSPSSTSLKVKFMLELKRLSLRLSQKENDPVKVYGGRRSKSAHRALPWSELFFVIGWSSNVCQSQSDETDK